MFHNDPIQIPIAHHREQNITHHFTPIYAVDVENISKSIKSNSKKNTTYENFGHLNQSLVLLNLNFAYKICIQAKRPTKVRFFFTLVRTKSKLRTYRVDKLVYPSTIRLEQNLEHHN